MSDTLAIIAVLRAGARAIAQDADPAVAAIGAGLQRLIDGDAASLEEAFGLPATWRTIERRTARDEHIRHLAATLCPGLSAREAARRVCQEAGRYRATRWRSDQAAHRRPDGLRGQLFDVLSAGECPGFNQVRNILSDLSG